MFSFRNTFSRKLIASLLISLLFPYHLFSKEKKDYKVESVGNNPKLPTVAIITTGGTIAEKIDPQTGGAFPSLSGKQLVEAVPELLDVANLKVINFCNVDSSQMYPAIWAKLAKLVDNVFDDSKIAGVVITHGTDTLAEGSFFLELTVKSAKPVVLVGAMRTASELSSDGPGNLLDGVIQAVSPTASEWGVTLTMNNYINQPRYVRKSNSTNVQTFVSGLKGYLGYITTGKVKKLNSCNLAVKLPIPEKLPKVALLTTFSGADGTFIRSAVDSGFKGIVIEAFGAGNLNDSSFKAIKYALSQGVIVVITTHCYEGGAWPVYGDSGGGHALKNAGAILADELDGPKARLLLMLLIPEFKVKKREIEKYF